MVTTHTATRTHGAWFRRRIPRARRPRRSISPSTLHWSCSGSGKPTSSGGAGLLGRRRTGRPRSSRSTPRTIRVDALDARRPPHGEAVGDVRSGCAAGLRYLPAARRCQRVRLSIFLCFFLRMRLRRFLIREPMRGATLPAAQAEAPTSVATRWRPRLPARADPRRRSPTRLRPGTARGAHPGSSRSMGHRPPRSRCHRPARPRTRTRRR